MTLRKQTLLFFCFALLFFLIALMIVTSTIFLQGFTRVEQTNTTNDLQLTSDSLAVDIASLTQLQQDWAEWDDAYQFVTDQNSNFVQANLNDSTLARLNLRILTFLNTDNKIVYSTGIDRQTGEANPLPVGFSSYLSPGSPLLPGGNPNSNNKISGIILLPEPENPLLVVSTPILTSDGTGPSNGTLILARSLDETALQNLATRLHFPLKIERYNATDLPADFRQARASLNLSENFPVNLQTLDDKTDRGYMVLKDISGKPALIMRIEISRQIYQQGQTSLYYLIAFIIVLFILFGGITLFLMEIMLLRRIADLKNEVKGVALSGNLATRVAVKGKDEIATLAQVTNQMLAALEQSRTNARVSENRFRLLIEKLPVGVTLHDATAKVQLANQAAADLLGLSLEQLTGKSYHESDWTCIHEDGTDFPEESRPVNRAEVTKKPVRNVPMGIYRPRDDSWVWLLVNAEPVLDDTGKLTNIICSFNDITDRKKVEELKTEFISVVSHELRTPLTSIVGSLGLIIGGVAGEIPPIARSMIDIAYKNSDRLVRLINDILDIQKIESGKMTFHKKPLELTPLVEQAITATRSYAQPYGVSFEFQEDKKFCKVLTDSDRLTQVIINLLSNAAKFSPSGGIVKIFIECPDDKTARIAIADNGPGISEEFQSRIFQKFAQADSSATRQKGGTGLGLSISKIIMQKLKGNLSFTTVVGEGTTFYIELPLLETQTSERVIPDASPVIINM